MKNFLSILALTCMLQSCITTKHPPASNNQLGATKMEQLYPGHTMLKTEEVPQAVRNSWQGDHSAVNGEEWYKEDSGYVVYYLSKKLQSRILYTANGEMVMRSHEVKSDDVPATIREYMKAKYPGIQYGRTFLSYTNGEDDKRYYELQVDDHTWEVFDSNGNHLDKK